MASARSSSATARSRRSPSGRAPADARAIDARGKWVTPGFIDLHVHLREPGQEYKETIATGARAAVGGRLHRRLRDAEHEAGQRQRVGDRARARPRRGGGARARPPGRRDLEGQKGEELAEFGELMAAGAVAVSDDGRPVITAALMRRALEYAQAFGLPVTVHEEDLQLAGGGVMHEGATSTRLGLKGIPARPRTSWSCATSRSRELTGGRLHVAHVSTAGAVRAIREAKARGLAVTGEVTRTTSRSPTRTSVRPATRPTSR